MPLAEYNKKRKFDETPEPAGRKGSTPDGNSFTVQKHAASQLHYDFRLEIEGVLASWAVPKGPSMNPAEKRLAAAVEDHPLDYGGFEGTIPEGNYGAGTVMLWDRGTFEIEGEAPASEQLAKGEIKFTLHGEKLHGSFVLIHTGKRSKDPRRARQWLLIKHRDEHADPDWDANTLSRSILTGRSMEEIAAGKPVQERARG